MVIVGPETLFPGAETIAFSDIRDGTSNTLMVVETKGQPVHWMEPTDLDSDRTGLTINGPSSGGISSHHPGGAQVAMADGSVRFFSDIVDEETLKSMVTINGGEVVEY